MNYTTNYHLPQWVESDRILMEDFNDAMANIDQELENQNRIWDGVLQLGSHYLQKRFYSMDKATLIQKENLLLNPLSSEEMALSLDGARWSAENGVYIGRGPELDRTLLRGSCLNFTTGYTDTEYIESTASYEFVAPIDGVIRAFDLRYYFFFYEGCSLFSNGQLTFTAYKKSGNDYIPIYQKSQIPLEMEGTEAILGGIPVTVEIPLEKDITYRFSLHMDSGKGALGRFGFTAGMLDSEDIDDSEFTITYSPVTSGSHTRMIPLSKTASHALLILQYEENQDKNTGNISAMLDSLPMSEWGSTQAADGNDTYKEITFTCVGNFSDETTLSILLACDETNDLKLKQYALLLL